MTNQEAIEAIKLARSQVEWDYPMDYAAAFDKAIEALEQEPTTNNDLGVDCISRQAVLDLINADWKYENLEIEINNLPSVTPQEPTDKNFTKADIDAIVKAINGGWEQRVDKIRDQLKSNLRGVEITLEVLVENDPLRPKMEGAKSTLEECLKLIEQAEAESI